VKRAYGTQVDCLCEVGNTKFHVHGTVHRSYVRA